MTDPRLADALERWQRAPFPLGDADDEVDELHAQLGYWDSIVSDVLVPLAEGRELAPVRLDISAGLAEFRLAAQQVHRARQQELSRDAVYKLLAYDYYAELMEEAIRAAGPLLEQYIAGNNERE